MPAASSPAPPNGVVHRPPLVFHRTRRRIAPFRLHRPTTAAEAAALLARLDGAVAMSGGLDLIDRMKAGLAPAHVVHLGAVAGLAAVERCDRRRRDAPGAGGVLRLGAGVSHARLAGPETAAVPPDLADAWRMLGNGRVRRQGTVGGNLMAGRGDYDGLPILLALDARAVFVGADGAEVLRPLDDLIRPDGGGFSPVPGLLTAVLPRVGAGVRLAYARELRPALGVVLGLVRRGEHTEAARASLVWAHPVPVVRPVPGVAGLDAAGLARSSRDLAEAWAATLPPCRDDAHAGAAYRRRVAPVLLRRLIERLAAEAAVDPACERSPAP